MKPFSVNGVPKLSPTKTFNPEHVIAADAVGTKLEISLVGGTQIIECDTPTNAQQALKAFVGQWTGAMLATS